MGTSVANNGEFEGGQYLRGLPRVSEMYKGDQRFLMGKNVIFTDCVTKEQENGLVQNSTVKTITCSDESSLSSIGKNSDVSIDKSEDDDDEVQSSCKGPLNSMVAELDEVLDDVLPTRWGISRFYKGRSKSFATLPDASLLPDIKYLAKSEDTYTRRRRNLLARNTYWGITRNSSHLRSNGGAISKKVTGSSRTTLALAVAMNNFDESDKLMEKESLPEAAIKNDLGCWRSFSLADLQHCVSATNSNQVPTKLS